MPSYMDSYLERLEQLLGEIKIPEQSQTDKKSVDEVYLDFISALSTQTGFVRWENTTVKQHINAIHYMSEQAAAQPIAIIDATILSSGKKGVLFDKDGTIYVKKNSSAAMFQISQSDLLMTLIQPTISSLNPFPTALYSV